MDHSVVFSIENVRAAQWRTDHGTTGTQDESGTSIARGIADWHFDGSGDTHSGLQFTAARNSCQRTTGAPVDAKDAGRDCEVVPELLERFQ